MYFLKSLEESIKLHPSWFHSAAGDIVRRKLYTNVEGKNLGNHHVIAVVSIDDVSEPMIQSGTGYAQYNVAYRALVWRPFRGEVVDGVVKAVTLNGIFVEVGGLDVFVSRSMMPQDLKYSTEGSMPSYVNAAEGMTIERDVEVRVRIKGLRGEIGNMFAIGSIKEDYLGALMQGY